MNWQLFFSVYLLIFLAELPDKTAFATLLLAAKGRAAAVFSGVAVAFLVQTLVATLFGSAIALLPEKWVHLGAGVLFLGFAVHMWRERIEEEVAASEAGPLGRNTFWTSAWKAFVVIFIAEWGDLTQIATASLIAKYSEFKLTVFLAALLALWSVTAFAVIIGQKAKSFLNPTVLVRACAILYFCIGIYFVANVIMGRG
jgi:putative Ca2+/H+ antiporter (TMEM165/GDT1 family)